MHLRKLYNSKTDRTYLSIVHSYRDKDTKKTRAKTIESLGYLDELAKKYKNPIAFFEAKVKQMNDQAAKDKTKARRLTVVLHAAKFYAISQSQKTPEFNE